MSTKAYYPLNEIGAGKVGFPRHVLSSKLPSTAITLSKSTP